MFAVRSIKNKPNNSLFREKLNEAVKFGKDWEGRDIRYYKLNEILEKAQLENKDHIEVKKAQLKN